MRRLWERSSRRRLGHRDSWDDRADRSTVVERGEQQREGTVLERFGLLCGGVCGGLMQVC